MLTDIHWITGYLIASWLYEKNALLLSTQTKGSILSTVLKKSSIGSYYKYTNRWKALEWVVEYLGRRKWSRYLSKVITSILEPIIPSSFESKYIAVGCILANLPDIDIFISFIVKQISYAFQRSGVSLNLKPLRRTWTHSIITNAIAIPFLSLIVKFILLGSRRVTFRNALALTTLTITSHQFLDYIVCYGVALMYPSNRKFYTLGVITEWDFASYLYFYSWFSLMRWRHKSWRRSRILLYGSLGYIFYLVWRRAMLCEVYKSAHHYMNRLKNQKHARFPGGKGPVTLHSVRSSSNVHVWLQPSNVIIGRYTVMAYDSSRQKVFRCNVFTASRLLSLLTYLRGWLAILPKKIKIGRIIQHRPDFRVSTLSQDMGKFQAISAPKEYYESLPVLWYNTDRNQSNRKKKSTLLATLLINQYSPTILLICSYHFTAFLINKRINRRITLS